MVCGEGVWLRSTPSEPGFLPGLHTGRSSRMPSLCHNAGDAAEGTAVPPPQLKQDEQTHSCTAQEPAEEIALSHKTHRTHACGVCN